MALRGDEGAEIGVFEDLQTLLVVVVGLAVLVASALYNWGVVADFDEGQRLYDAARDVLRAVEAWDRLRASDPLLIRYNDFMLYQPELATMYGNRNVTDDFSERVRVDAHYNVTFDDLDVPDAEHGGGNASHPTYSFYSFGEPVPDGAELVALQTHYALVMATNVTSYSQDVSVRHLCLVTVEVWR